MTTSSVQTETNILSIPSPSHQSPKQYALSFYPALSHAQTLPPHILIDILLEVVRLQEHEGVDSTERIDGAMHGGRVLQWDSHESIRHLTLVCRNWEDSASFVLYRSVALLSATSTQVFLRTAVQRPSLAQRTAFLVLGLGKHRENAVEEVGAHLLESLELAKVLGVCSNVRHLQLRPIHHGARSELLNGLRWLELSSFAYVARFQGSGWFKGLFRPEDLAVLLSPSIHKLELDFNTNDPVDDSPLPPALIPHSLTPILLLCLQIDFPSHHVLAIVTSCVATLQHLELYLETPIDRKEVVRAVTPCGPTLRSLSIITNPETDSPSSSSQPSLPLVDLLLPHLPNLEIVRTAAHDVSVEAFSNLPSSLCKICIHTFGVELLDSPQTLLGAIHRIPRGSHLPILCIHDTLDVWDEGDVKEMIWLCRARGLSFTLSDVFDCHSGI